MDKVLVRVPVTAEEKREMAEAAKRAGMSLTAWAAGAIRAARQKRPA